MYFVQWFLSKNIAFQKIKEDLKKKQQLGLEDTTIDEDLKLSKEVA